MWNSVYGTPVGDDVEINNQIYDQKGDSWWDDDGDDNLVSLRYLNNPIKFDYFKMIIDTRIKSNPDNNRVLDVGCGGGYLSEELARIDLDVVGVDPSAESIRAARKHADQENLDITYVRAAGEDLPFDSASFDFVCCCDVLEHVNDFGLVVGEIARVLKRGGVFFFDTVNRNPVSWLVMIKILQDWPGTAFLDRNVHVWRMFIKPRELIEAMEQSGLVNQEIKGLSPGMNFMAHYLNLRRRTRGKISWPELSKRLKLGLSNNRSNTYLGYAFKAY